MRIAHRLFLIPVCALALFLAACAGSSSQADELGLTIPDDFDVQLIASGFAGPTQMVHGQAGQLIVAELNGAENDGTGRVVQLDLADPDERIVLQTDLDKPTGIAVVGDRLWIMERQRLSYAGLEPGAERVVVADDLPFNGRSQGTLTVTAGGDLLYDTSGSKRGPDRVPGSGTLFRIPNAAIETESEVVATGFKHAYAHLIDPDGQLWAVEMTDGRFDELRASDELVAVTNGSDAGWPQCVDDNRPVLEFGGTAAECADKLASHALFGPGATPTSLALAPWDDSLFVVPLWLPGTVVTVPRSPLPDGPHEPTVFIEGIESPQHVLANGDQLLISDHESGQLLAVSKN